jgi:hypothetical protein
MNNKPVAWLYKIKNTDNRWELSWIRPINDKFFETEPLYRHPSEHDLGIAEAIGFDKGYKAATAKTLTDEEINEIFSKTWLDLKDYKDFARAILKKASEK